MSDRQPTAFVIMPFDSELDEVYKLFIHKTLTDLGFTVDRADSINNQRSILADIIVSIAESDIIIADLTSSNANVYYELGIAHAFDKPVILLTQDIEEVPFDLRPYRLLPYNVHFARIEEAQQRLREIAQGFLNGTSTFGNPVSDYKNVMNPSASARPTRNVKRSDEAETDGANGGDLSEEDDRGFLDHLEVIEEGFSSLQEIMEANAEDITKVAMLAKGMSSDLNALNQDKSSGATSRKRKRLQQFAGQLDEVTGKFKEANGRYSVISDEIDESLEFVITYQGLSAENAEALSSFLEILRALKQSGIVALSAINGLTTTIDRVPNAERRTNRSLRLMRDETQFIADNIEKTIATASRGINIGEEILNRFNKDNDSGDNAVRDFS